MNPRSSNHANRIKWRENCKLHDLFFFCDRRKCSSVGVHLTEKLIEIDGKLSEGAVFQPTNIKKKNKNRHFLWWKPERNLWNSPNYHNVKVIRECAIRGRCSSARLTYYFQVSTVPHNSFESLCLIYSVPFITYLKWKNFFVLNEQ